MSVELDKLKSRTYSSYSMLGLIPPVVAAGAVIHVVHKGFGNLEKQSKKKRGILFGW